MKNITILGSTGSIGTQTLQVIEETPLYRVRALAAYSNWEKVLSQIQKFHPDVVCVYQETAASALTDACRKSSIPVRIVTGMEGLLECATLPEVDLVVGAMVGMIGIRPTLAAIEAGKDIALANKETLVCAGHLIVPLAREKKTALLPVDSEHSAIFQVLQGTHPNEVRKILLTASGGPFRGKSREELERVTVQDALRHPNWTMGPKITVDCSTLVNKGLEVMEAKWLFGVDLEQIQVVIHPQSVIHSMVEFADGAVLAQMGVPDMRLPIQYALTYPDRLPLSGERLDFWRLPQLTFEKPDFETFPALELAYEAGKEGGSLPTVFNAANECAVDLFLKGKIGYRQIVPCISAAMRRHSVIPNPSLDEIFSAQKEAEENVREFIGKSAASISS